MGKAKVTAFEFTIPVGGPATSHTHSFPVLVIIPDGEANISHEDGKVSIFKAGEALIEDVGTVHSSENAGTVPVKALIIAIGIEGQNPFTPIK